MAHGPKPINGPKGVYEQFFRDFDESKIIEEKEAQGDYEQFFCDAAHDAGRSQMQEAELEEKDAQGDYGQFTKSVVEKDGAESLLLGNLGDGKPVEDSKSIAEKDGAKASIAEKDGAKAYGKPVDFCTKSQRWRDARGRFCRPPSPAR